MLYDMNIKEIEYQANPPIIEQTFTANQIVLCLCLVHH